MSANGFKVPILMYHRVAVRPQGTTVPGHYCPPEAFASHMHGLRRLGFQSISLSSLAECIRTGRDPGRRCIVVTFDDGYRNFIQHALPALAASGLNSTVFLVSDLIGGTNEWDERAGDAREPLMSLTEICEAQRQGTEIGSHTRRHADLAACDEAAAWQEIAGSKTQLEDALKRPVTVFCYPYGHYNREVRSMVERAGYAAACATTKGVATPGSDLFALNRINVRSDTTLPLLLYKLVRGLALGR
jgi:peptidoglycan/xylan/chitin deacetylase (PgdA/CDA1 family)